MLLTLLGWLVVARCWFGTIGFILGLIAIAVKLTNIVADWLDAHGLW